jgi:hypothetical protein
LSINELRKPVPNFLTKEFYILERKYVPSEDKQDFDKSYAPGAGNLF